MIFSGVHAASFWSGLVKTWSKLRRVAYLSQKAIDAGWAAGISFFTGSYEND